MSGLSPCELELLGTLLRQLGRHAAGEEAALDDAVRAR
jgi:hypothetical protein